MVAFQSLLLDSFGGILSISHCSVERPREDRPASLKFKRNFALVNVNWSCQDAPPKIEIKASVGYAYHDPPPPLAVSRSPFYQVVASWRSQRALNIQKRYTNSEQAAFLICKWFCFICGCSERQDALLPGKKCLKKYNQMFRRAKGCDLCAGQILSTRIAARRCWVS